MALVTCYECGREISASASSCPQCGAKKKRSGPSLLLVIPLGAAAVFGLLLIIAKDSKVGPPDEQSLARKSIDFCWQEYEKKSNSQNEKVFIARACEKLESDFTKKYGITP